MGPDAGEPVSVSVDSEDSSLNLSQLSPGSSYEVTVLSTLGLDESDPIKDLVMTREFNSKMDVLHKVYFKLNVFFFVLNIFCPSQSLTLPQTCKP